MANFRKTPFQYSKIRLVSHSRTMSPEKGSKNSKKYFRVEISRCYKSFFEKFKKKRLPDTVNRCDLSQDYLAKFSTLVLGQKNQKTYYFRQRVQAFCRICLKKQDCSEKLLGSPGQVRFFSFLFRKNLKTLDPFFVCYVAKFSSLILRHVVTIHGIFISEFIIKS